jgi:hypothetical protein
VNLIAPTPTCFTADIGRAGDCSAKQNQQPIVKLRTGSQPAKTEMMDAGILPVSACDSSASVCAAI